MLHDDLRTQYVEYLIRDCKLILLTDHRWENEFWMSDFDIPKERVETISQSHNSTVEYLGIDRTVRLLTEQGHTWKNLRMHVKRCVKRGPCCQKMSHVTPLIVAHIFTLIAQGPFMRINSCQLHAYLLAHPDTRFRSMIPKKFIVDGEYRPDDLEIIEDEN